MTQWIDHAGKAVFYVDCRNINTRDDFFKQMDDLEREYEKTGHAGERNQILVILDVTDAGHLTDEVKQRMKAVTQKSAAYGFAVVGVSGIKKLIANAIRKDVYFANDITDAKEWLVKQPKPE